MRAANVNGHDGFLRPDRPGPVGHGHRKHTETVHGFVGKATQDGRQFVLPSIEFQSQHVRLAFRFSG